MIIKSVVLLLMLTSLCMHGQVRPSGEHIALIYSTDLYSPPDDPDDHFDLATLFSLREIDVSGIVLDQQRYDTSPQSEASGEIPLQQMFSIAGRSAPSRTGLRYPLRTVADKCLDQPPQCQAGVDLILDLLRKAKAPVTILTVGTERDIAAAFNREPALFRNNVSRVYLNTGIYGFPEGRIDVNLEKDRNAFLAIMKSGLPVYWVPCFGEDNYESYWRVDQRTILENATRERQNYFLFAFSKEKTPAGAPTRTAISESIAFLDRPVDSVAMKKIYALKRNMWSTASLIHAAGSKIFRAAHYDFVASSGPAGEYTREVVPYSFTKMKLFIDEQGRVHPGKTGNVEVHVFHKDNPQEYADALTSILKHQFGAPLEFQDPTLPRDQRVADLVSRMTLKEKISQMQNHAPAIPRLHVPEYDWWNEALHGVARNGVATVFPQAIGMAATWDPDLIRQEADVISTEARAKHHEALRSDQRSIYKGLTFWSPNINIYRDPRWGRGQETYGEDPYLTSRIGVAFVKGLQGDDPVFFKTVSTPKHFAVHSGPEPLRHGFDARTRTRDLYETYLPAFEACITEGGAWSVMGAYNRFDGEPCCASHRLLGDFLRGAWKFRGYVVSDCGAINDMFEGHKTARSVAEASAFAVRAGCDLTCGTEYEALTEAVAQRLISEKEIDVSVSRLMDARFRLGMFDPPESVPWARIPIAENDTEVHSALALKVAQESIVLLKNSRRALPLRKDLRSIAVIGPTADDLDVLVGNYSGTPSHPVTILQGIRNKVGSGATVSYARGSELASVTTSSALLDEALAIAGKADQIIAVLGLSPQLEGEEMPVKLDGFSGGDRTNLNLPPAQEKLLKALARLGKPVVLVLTSGSALAVNWGNENIPAILEAWYPGQRGGDAVADVLFGDYNPSGRLPVTFYSSVADLPSFENYSMEGRTYRFYAGKPLYPFGFGLSYSRFEYNQAKVLTPAVRVGDTIRVSVTLKNTGALDGDEVVQVYMRSKTPRPEDPIKSLKGFARTHLKHGETRTVVVPVAAHNLRVFDQKTGKYAAIPGTYELMIGASSSDIRFRTSFRLLP